LIPIFIRINDDSEAWTLAVHVNNANNFMKTIAAILLLALICGCEKSVPPALASKHTNSIAENLFAKQKLAEQIFHEAVAHDVVGLSRVIQYRFIPISDNVTNWKAEAVVEVVNHFGGIDRTNIPFYFLEYVSDVGGQTNIMVQIDGLEIYHRELREIDSRPQ
jgi:hypothetical protein